MKSFENYGLSINDFWHECFTEYLNQLYLNLNMMFFIAYLKILQKSWNNIT